MGIDTFTIKTHHTILQCDVCDHVAEYEYEERKDGGVPEPEYRDKQVEMRKKQLDGWNYSYYKIESVWDSQSRFSNPDLSEMKQVLMCPMCSKENL